MNIYDIAKKANVSIATVSRVLNGNNTVKPATREKILQIIKAENYRPNAFARGLSTDSAKLAGVICTDLSDAFFAKAASLLQNLLRKQGFTMLLGCSGDTAHGKQKQIDFMLEKRIDVLFLIGSAFCDTENMEYLKKVASSVLIITINANCDSDNVYSIYCDDADATFNAVNTLYKKGHKRIMYIYDSVTPSATAKLSGYIKGLKENSIYFDESLVVKTEKSILGGKSVIKNAVSTGIIPDAVITSEDILAIGAIKGMQEAKISPTVIGYNNSPLCECTTPTLSSIDNKLESMCQKGIEVMNKFLIGEKTDKKYKYSAEIIFRETLGED